MSFIKENGLLLGGFLAITDLWRSYSSPLQHPFLDKPKDSKIRGSRRDTLYLFNLLLSGLVFAVACRSSTRWIQMMLVATALYRSVDLLIALLRIAVIGAFGLVPSYKLNRVKIMHNTLAVFVNYVELVFWYAAVYAALSIKNTSQFYPTTGISPALCLILSFTTLTTIGYGNIAPQKMVSGLICSLEAFTAIVMLSCVVGSLVSLSASNPSTATPSEAEGKESETIIALPGVRREPLNLPSNNWEWVLQRAATLAIFCAIGRILQLPNLP
jgi:hypothetical protein